MRTILIIVLQLASSGADAYYTHRNLNPHWRESDPIARPFVQTARGQVGYFSATTGVKLAIPRLIHKRKLARVIEIGGIVDNAGGAWYSAAHYQKEKR